jgi:uncharacterized protein (DUF488 family)
MPTVYTIGFQRKPLSEFIHLLRENHVKAVIDIRLRNTSQLSGYAKRDDLAFVLREGFGVAYEHHLDLAPTDGIFDSFHQDRDWSSYEESFRHLLVERRAEEAGREILSRYGAICLLCSEPAADQCHRRLVAEYWADHIPDLAIVHL